jgi:hypothetical protein
MPIRKELVIATVAMLGLNVVAPQATAETAKINTDAAYSATRIIEGGEQRMEQRYFQKNGATNRMEMNVHGQQSTVIVNGERGVMWILMPAQSMYMESPIDDQPFDGANVEIPDPATWEMEREGRESVNGVPATRYRVATDDGEVTRMRGHVWVSDDGIPVRTDMVTGGDRIQMELRDVVVGPQPDELFEPPAGYRGLSVGAGHLGSPAGMASGASDASFMGAELTGGPGASAAGTGSGFAEELAAEAAEEAKRATTDEVRQTVNDTVRKGLRGVLNRK